MKSFFVLKKFYIFVLVIQHKDMETQINDVNELLKLRTPQLVAQEIAELESVKKSYFYFLATHVSKDFPENVSDVEANMKVVKDSLTELYLELQQIRAIISTSVRTVKETEIKRSVYKASTSEANAIMLFNKDKRFSITE